MIDTVVENYFSNRKMFSQSLHLNERIDVTWEEISNRAPTLPKGWFELSQLPPGLSLEFMRDFWGNALPSIPHLCAFFDRFFAGVEGVEIYLAARKKNGPFESFFVYKMRASTDFFLGSPPLNQNQIDQMTQNIPFPFPEDYLRFLWIHDGFQKGGEAGIFVTTLLLSEQRAFLKEIKEKGGEIRCECEKIDPQALFPFYRSLDLDSCQCFYKNWHHDEEVGNVSFSLSKGEISYYKNREKEEKTFAFNTFLDWFVFYVERIKK